MNQVNSESKFTMVCPSGHRVRGGAELVGQTVRCPKCQASFVFLPEPHPAPQPRSLPRQPGGTGASQAVSVTDTGVMRILGDMEPDRHHAETGSVALRPCTRCGVAIAETLTVCTHCKCYIGVLPSFMKQLSGDLHQRT